MRVRVRVRVRARVYVYCVCVRERCPCPPTPLTRKVSLPTHPSHQELLVPREYRRPALCGLVDILFAYCYDTRTTDGEHNVESAWTIIRLSSTFSWLGTFLMGTSNAFALHL